jgi:hypothetical protein
MTLLWSACCSTVPAVPSIILVEEAVERQGALWVTKTRSQCVYAFRDNTIMII